MVKVIHFGTNRLLTYVRYGQTTDRQAQDCSTVGYKCCIFETDGGGIYGVAQNSNNSRRNFVVCNTISGVTRTSEGGVYFAEGPY